MIGNNDRANSPFQRRYSLQYRKQSNNRTQQKHEFVHPEYILYNTQKLSSGGQTFDRRIIYETVQKPEISGFSRLFSSFRRKSKGSSIKNYFWKICLLLHQSSLCFLESKVFDRSRRKSSDTKSDIGISRNNVYSNSKHEPYENINLQKSVSKSNVVRRVSWFREILSFNFNFKLREHIKINFDTFEINAWLKSRY